MPVIAVRIPQMGEGLQEALLVEFLKEPGDTVKRDDPIYVMETDKATTDVESPYDGTLVEWTAEPGSVMAIGSEVGRMEVAEGVKEMAAGHGPVEDSTADNKTDADPQSSSADNSPSDSSNEDRLRKIPPRTRKYLKEKGVLDRVGEIAISGTKMMPDDVDRFLAQGGGSDGVDSEDYAESPVPISQVTLNYRLVRGVSSSVPVTVMQTVDWEAIASARKAAKASQGDDAPSGFLMLTRCVVEALKDHPKFRSTLVNDGKTIRTFNNVNLGIAVGLTDDQLLTAVVKSADEKSTDEYYSAAKTQIELARQGTDQADSSVSVSVSNIGSAGMRWGIPAIVSPAVATLAVGEVYDRPIPNGDGFAFRKTVELTLSFDHRLLNGVGAAEFMNDLKNRVENYS